MGRHTLHTFEKSAGGITRLHPALCVEIYVLSCELNSSLVAGQKPDEGMKKKKKKKKNNLARIYYTN